MDNLNAPTEQRLIRYMESADATAREMLRKNDPEVACLMAFDRYLQVQVWTRAPAKPSIGVLLVMNAGLMYLAASRTALSGHASAVYPLLRAALESACYGLLIHARPELGDIWKSRHANPEARKAQRKAITFEQALKALKPRSQVLHDAAQELYDGAIDFGAHPNPMGVFPHMSIDEERTDELVSVSMTALHGPGAVETFRGVVACLDFGFVISGVSALALGAPAPIVTEDLRRLLALKAGVLGEDDPD